MDNREDDSDGSEKEETTQFSNIFQMMNQADKSLGNLRSKQIMLVGLSRIGKSTTHNWITGKPMIGMMKNGQVSYVNIGTDGSPVNDGLNSLTLIANKVQIGDIDILDMAGFGDTRSHIGVLGVSYCLKRVFDAGQRFKFILVISENALKTAGSNDVIRSFNYFFGMFRISDMDANVKKMFLDSISLLITRTQNSYRLTEFIQALIRDLELPTCRISGKENIIEVLNLMMTKNRITTFQQAQSDINSTPCGIIEELTSLGWDYFNLKELNASNPRKRSYINLPFKKEFDKLGTKQRNKLTDSITNRLASYQTLSQALGHAFEVALKAQYSTQINYESVFVKFNAYLEANDHYKSEQEIDFRQLSNTPDIKTDVMLHRQLINLMKLCTNIRPKEYVETPAQFMQNYLLKLYDQVFRILLDTICSSSAEEKIILRVRYVGLRGFPEFSTINQIDKEIGATAYTDIPETLAHSLPEGVSIQEVYEHFFLKITPEIMKLVYKSNEKKKILDNYADEFENGIQYKVRNTQKFSHFRYELKRRLCLDYKQNADYREAARYGLDGSIQLLKSLQQYIKQSGIQITPDLQHKQIIDKSLKIQELLSYIITCALKSKNSENMKLALKMCLHMKDSYSTDLVYSQLLKKEQDAEDLTERKRLLVEYAEQCANHCQFEKAQALLSQRLSIEFECSNAKKDIQETLMKYVDDQFAYKSSWKDNIQWNRVIRDDQEMRAIFEQVKNFVDSPSSATLIPETNIEI